MPFCSNCGREYSLSEKYCNNCGVSLQGNSASNQTQTTATPKYNSASTSYNSSKPKYKRRRGYPLRDRDGPISKPLFIISFLLFPLGAVLTMFFLALHGLRGYDRKPSRAARSCVTGMFFGVFFFVFMILILA